MNRQIIKRYIFISILFFIFYGQVYAQNNASIKGSVVSGFNDGLEGVNVVLKGTKIGTATDEKGQFVLKNLKSGDYILEISALGFEKITKSITLQAGEKKEMTFTLNESITQLSEIMIRGQGFDPKNQSITVNEIDREQLQRLNIDLPIRVIEQIPGVELNAYYQGGVADQFSIRGFGGGGHEGQAGVQIDGVSLNEAEGHSDGYADMNILIPLNLEKVKVYKGPSSVLFGRFAEGGTLAMETRKGGNYEDVSVSGGAFNTLNAQYATGKTFELSEQNRELKSNFALQFFQSDGYADNSDNLRGNLTGRLSYQLSDKTDIALSLRGHGSEWDVAGYIPKDQVNDEDRRTQQAENAENDGGNKQFYSQKLDINHTFNDDLRLLIFGYAVQQNFTRFAKFGFDPGGQTERFNTRDVFATGATLNGKNNLANVKLDWVAGTEFYTETTDRKRWSTSERVRNEQILDRSFDVQTLSAYFQGVFDISKFFRPSIGLRYDTFSGFFNNNDPDIQPFKNDIDQLSNVTPKLGLRSSVLEGLDLRLSASNGFTLPNSTRKYEEDANLDPTQLWQYELGASYKGLDWLELDVVGFVLDTSNEILENPPGSGDFVNIGETRRTGIETEAIIKPSLSWRIRGTFSYTDTEVKENPNDELVGKSVTNIPQTIATLDVSYAFKNGLGSRFTIRDVGSYYTNQVNTAGYDGYTVANLTLFYNFNAFFANRGRVFIEVNNLFDSLYSEIVFGGVDSQIFTPAPTRNVMMGVKYNF